MISAGWIDQWTFGDNDADLSLHVDMHALTMLWRPADCVALQWIVCGVGFWVRWDWE